MRKLFVAGLFLMLIYSGSLWAQGCMGGGSSEGVNVIGFIQPQLEYNFAEDASGEADNSYNFTFNRARIGVTGNIPYDVSYYFILEASPFKGDVKLCDAFTSYTLLAPYATFSIGRFKSPFGLERNTPCQGLYTVKRSLVTDNLVLDRDMGLMAYGNYNDLVNYTFALTHGTGSAAVDNNKAKDISARVVLSPIEMVKVGGSWQTGKQPAADPTAEEEDIRTRFAGELQFEYKNFLVQGEYISGKMESSGGIVAHPPDCTHDTTWYTVVPPGESKSGGYWGFLAYTTPWELQPIVKYEFYDPDADTDDNELSIITFGFNYFINDWSRIQVNYLYKAEKGNEIVNDEILFQFQALFN